MKKIVVDMIFENNVDNSHLMPCREVREGKYNFQTGKMIDKWGDPVVTHEYFLEKIPGTEDRRIMYVPDTYTYEDVDVAEFEVYFKIDGRWVLQSQGPLSMDPDVNTLITI